MRTSAFKCFTQRSIVFLFILHFLFNKLKGIECSVGHSDLPESWIIVSLRKLQLNKVIKNFEQRRRTTERKRTPKCSSLPPMLQNRIETDWWLNFHLFLCESLHELLKNFVVVPADQVNSLIRQPVRRMNHLHWLKACPPEIYQALDIPIVVSKDISLAQISEVKKERAVAEITAE